MRAALSQHMTYAEYCAFEREAAVKHEYLRGEVFALAGATLEHGRLAMQIGFMLGIELSVDEVYRDALPR